MIHSREKKQQGSMWVQWRTWYTCHLDRCHRWKSSQGGHPGDDWAEGDIDRYSSFRLAVLWEIKAQGWQPRFHSVCVWDEAVRRDPEI